MKKSLCWIRRDIRLHDHHALSVATSESDQVELVFVFDPNILSLLSSKSDSRLSFIIESLMAIQQQGYGLHLCYGLPEVEIPKLVKQLGIARVYANRDYEPYAKSRDEKVQRTLKTQGVEIDWFQDHVIFEKHQVLTKTRTLYKVFTPYKNQWLYELSQTNQQVSDYPVDVQKIHRFRSPWLDSIELCHQKLGFNYSRPALPGGTLEARQRLEHFKKKLRDYKKNRDFPALNGTSLISVDLRHGTLSIRDAFRLALSQKSEGSQTWLSELIWRDFYHMILDVHPYVTQRSFKPEYDKIKWPGKQEHFQAWCQGQTGVPIIDAAMRCFNATGMMHNRLRMIVASYLCKILLVDWRWGENYFAQKLLDFDLAANNGGWQWCSSSGCDAQPYFRIFNPYAQSEKFDPEGDFIKVWCPELSHLSSKEIHRPSHLKPIVEYESQRKKALVVYSVVKG